MKRMRFLAERSFGERLVQRSTSKLKKGKKAEPHLAVGGLSSKHYIIDIGVKENSLLCGV
jgi:hypothetical protein